MNFSTGPPEWLLEQGDLLCSISLCCVIMFGIAGSLTSQSYPDLSQVFTPNEVSVGMVSKALTLPPPNYPLLL